MAVKKGYKQTEVGVIPEDWEVKKLGEIAEIATGSTPPTHDRTNYGDEYFFVSPIDLGKGKWIKDTKKNFLKRVLVWQDNSQGRVFYLPVLVLLLASLELPREC
jgi:restriction endonuclease S subunit